MKKAPVITAVVLVLALIAIILVRRHTIEEEERVQAELRAEEQRQQEEFEQHEKELRDAAEESASLAWSLLEAGEYDEAVKEAGKVLGDKAHASDKVYAEAENAIRMAGCFGVSLNFVLEESISFNGAAEEEFWDSVSDDALRLGVYPEYDPLSELRKKAMDAGYDSFFEYTAATPYYLVSGGAGHELKCDSLYFDSSFSYSLGGVEQEAEILAGSGKSFVARSVSDGRAGLYSCNKREGITLETGGAVKAAELMDSISGNGSGTVYVSDGEKLYSFDTVSGDGITSVSGDHVCLKGFYDTENESCSLWTVTADGKLELRDGESLGILAEYECPGEVKDIYAGYGFRKIIVLTETGAMVCGEDGTFGLPDTEDAEAACWLDTAGTVLELVYADRSERWRLKQDPADSFGRIVADVPYGFGAPFYSEDSALLFLQKDGEVCCINALSGELIWLNEGESGLSRCCAPAQDGVNIIREKYDGSGCELIDMKSGVSAGDTAEAFPEAAEPVYSFHGDGLTRQGDEWLREGDKARVLCSRAGDESYELLTAPDGSSVCFWDGNICFLIRE
ncbi:MAG: hypothetical protein IKI75_12690 [Lachnospiraceae bacterium]|nr:hypothetical protein [Lachnospiraceae bacterium]